jgi:transposase
VTRSDLTDDEWVLVEAFLPIGQYGPYPERLRQQFEGVIWRFRTGGPWRDMPEVHGVWRTVYHRFVQWRDEGVFQALMEGLITESAARGQADLGLAGVDSTVARAHHDAAAMAVDEEVLSALEKAVNEEKGRAKSAKGANRT